MKTIQQNFKSKYPLMLVFALVMSILSGYSANLIQYSLTTNTASVPAGGVFSASPLLTLTASYSTNGATASGWNNADQYWLISPISTVGYHTVQVSAYMFSQATGPKDFKLQYNINSEGWEDAGVITLTTTSTNKLIELPAECANKASVQVRWISTNTTNVAAGAYSYIKTIRITGNSPTIPDSQTQFINFVSITPTTITIDASPGNGDHRIAVVNCVNNFTDPVDDQIFTANSTYNYSTGDHQQVVYVGEGTKFTITVPSSNNIYYVRYYEYDYNGSMTRYLTPEDEQNPKECALEAISTNDATSIRLTRATLGANISTPTRSAIQERGIVWKTSTGVTEADNKTIEGGLTGGSFSQLISSLPRGTRIYFKGYVTNESGTILGNEKYFDNIPIFTGTGTWENAALWNVQEVPGANGDPTYGSVDDSPIVNGFCTLTADNNVTNLTINASRSLTINKATTMKVNGTLLNNAGVNGILIKSIDNNSDVSPNGSLIFANGTVQASVEMFSKALWNLSNPAGSRFTWQYFGIPFTSYAYSSAFSAAYVRAWDESVIDYYNVWSQTNTGTTLQLTAGSNLLPGVAYELCQQANKKYLLSGTLINSDYNKTLQYTPTAYYKGQNMLSNPYTAAINIADLEFGANTTAAVYLYNSGTYHDWLSNSGESTPGSGPGTYTVSTPGTAGSGEVPAQIPSMQGFLVKATANPGSISYSYSNLSSNSEKQRAKSINNKVNTMIDLIGTNFSDRMWLFVDDNCTTGFDNGFDGPKLLGYNEVSQIYGIGTDDIYQINVLNDINEAYIGVQPGIETSFKVTFKHQNIDQKYVSLYLVDLVDNKTIDITADGSEYSFTSASTDPVKRFKIVGNTGTVTSNINNQISDIKLFTQNNLLMIDNKLAENGDAKIFDLSAKLLSTFDIQANSINTLQTDLKQGVYLVQIKVGMQNLTQRIIIK